jgi:hypothetical protein
LHLEGFALTLSGGHEQFQFKSITPAKSLLRVCFGQGRLIALNFSAASVTLHLPESRHSPERWRYYRVGIPSLDGCARRWCRYFPALRDSIISSLLRKWTSLIVLSTLSSISCFIGP